MMHFSGRTWRPLYEADSCIIELTAGCTYGKCNFCNLYENEPFRMVSLEQFEEDLQEIKDYQPHARRLFLTGANPHKRELNENYTKGEYFRRFIK